MTCVFLKNEWDNVEEQLPCSNGNSNDIIQVESAPLLNIIGKSCTEHSSFDLVGCAGQENGSQLVSEPSFAIFKQFI